MSRLPPPNTVRHAERTHAPVALVNYLVDMPTEHESDLADGALGFGYFAASYGQDQLRPGRAKALGVARTRKKIVKG